MVFPVVKYHCESWTIKKAEHRRIDAFELWCWRRLLTVPRTARRSNQSVLKEIKSGQRSLVGYSPWGHRESDTTNAAAACFMVQLSHPYVATGKTIALTRWTFVRKIMSLLFNTLSRLVITFLTGVSIF